MGDIYINTSITHLWDMDFQLVKSSFKNNHKISKILDIFGPKLL